MLTIKCWFEIAPTQIFVLKRWPTFFMPQKSKRGEMAGRKKAIYKACKGTARQTTRNILQFYLIAQLQGLCSCCCHLFSYFFHFDRHCVVWRTWPLLKAYRIWNVLPSLRNRYGESIRALQGCDRMAPTPAPLMSKRMAV